MASMENGNVLHVALFPWLAMGHLIPFFHLSKCLARKGHRVSLISTPRNLQRIPKIPSNLSSLINFICLPLPHVHNLPEQAESSTDIPYNKQQLLKRAFDLLKLPLTNFLESSHVDWIIYDYASHWLPSIAADLGISRAFFSLFNAAVLAFLGPTSLFVNGGGGDLRSSAEDFTVVPPWIPFESNMAYKTYEVTKYVDSSSKNESGTSDTIRFGVTIAGSDVVFVRSSSKLEPEWFNLLDELYQKPIIQVGFLPPELEDTFGETREKWVEIKQWLDKQRVNSVVYVALGSEATLSQDEVNELALGLEKSGLPFFWVLRNSPGSTHNELDKILDGFQERVKDRGVVHVGWAPQVSILSHEAVGGFVTHCGWNSVIEGLGFGRVLILFPMINDQGLNSRLLCEKKLGVEIPRDERDGSFTCDSVAECVRGVMVDDSFESMRAKAKQMRELFGSISQKDCDLKRFVCYLEDNTSVSNN
ncbi:UDP-glycosyltransferase [Quillaja saponaria]|uniref:UDP-glycosyltransferase n=1 Tax=Quillaja saponaria TaxID=32244 RepID=A0AAD7LYR1_QUISA|nr:UDP-glycosyltransferase [Quillaja saponaria]